MKKTVDSHPERTRFSRKKIFHDFKQGIFYQDLYLKYKISETELISILQTHVKGNFDYKKILRGGKMAQEKFLTHLRTRWNPLGEYEFIPL